MSSKYRLPIYFKKQHLTTQINLIDKEIYSSILFECYDPIHMDLNNNKTKEKIMIIINIFGL